MKTKLGGGGVRPTSLDVVGLVATTRVPAPAGAGRVRATAVWPVRIEVAWQGPLPVTLTAEVLLELCSGDRRDRSLRL